MAAVLLLWVSFFIFFPPYFDEDRLIIDNNTIQMNQSYNIKLQEGITWTELWRCSCFCPAVGDVTLDNLWRRSRLLWRPTRWCSRGLDRSGFVVTHQAAVHKARPRWHCHYSLCNTVHLNVFGLLHVSVSWLLWWMSAVLAIYRASRQRGREAHAHTHTHTHTHTHCTQYLNYTPVCIGSNLILC